MREQIKFKPGMYGELGETSVTFSPIVYADRSPMIRHSRGSEASVKLQWVRSARLYIEPDEMPTLRKLFQRIPLSLLIVLCLSLGLAPFTPEPHLVEKIKMLASGELGRLIDVFDLMLHGLPWLLLAIKLLLTSTGGQKELGPD